jgi:hypothetical protein
MAVDKGELGPQGQSLDRSAHRQKIRLADIEPIDFLDTRPSDSPRQGAFRNLCSEALSCSGREAL